MSTKKRNQNNKSKGKKRLVKISDLKSLKKINVRVAGIDIGSDAHFVACPDPKNEGKIVIKQFGSFTSELKDCVEWLKNCKIESVSMEATGVYWTILYSMLVIAGIKVVLVNARDFKKFKEKKTDVCDAEYLQLYHSYGLLEGAIIPEEKIIELRTFLRLREQSVEDSARAIQRMQKALIQMNLRLDNAISDITGATGMAIIDAILTKGERDPKKLAEFRDPRCKKTEKEIEESLNGFYKEEQLFALQQALDQFKFFISEIEKCDKKIEEKLSEFQNKISLEENKKEEPIKVKPPKKNQKPKKNKRLKPFEFSFDLRKELIRIAGVDLTQLPGIGPSAALTLISETGLDMTKWHSAKHFASYLRLTPNNMVSGGKVLKKRTRIGKSRAAITLRMSVSSLYSDANETALGAFYRMKRAQMGAPKAITAGANKLARMYYMTLSTGKEFKEYGAAEYLKMQQKRYLRRVKRTIAPWGYEIKEKLVA